MVLARGAGAWTKVGSFAANETGVRHGTTLEAGELTGTPEEYSYDYAH